MSEPVEPGQELEQAPVATAIQRRAEMLSDDEIRRMYRIAEALALSGAWKDVKNAEAAFAKMVIGRDLGMSPAQAMQGIYLVEGGIQMHYAMLGQFVRNREGYDYRAGWLKEEPPLMTTEGEGAAARAVPVEGQEPQLAVVWHNEEEPDDLRAIVGAVIEFTVDGERRGVSRFTLDDARKANLIKSDARAAWNTAPRNMLLARAMSNGIKWAVPEVLGGLPVYVEGELPAPQKSLTAPAGDGADEPQGIELGPKVEALIERAERVGHRGLSNRVAVEAAVAQRSPGVVNDWVVRAKAELDRFEAEKAAAEEEAQPITMDGVTLPVPPSGLTTKEAEQVEEVHGEVVADDPQERVQRHIDSEEDGDRAED